jgi:DNA-binding NarL/FixJ family response regulator
MRSLLLLCHDQAMRKTVLIVDDHDGFRDSARTLLESEGFEVVGTCANGASAMAAVERLRPDVVLLDVQLPDLDGFAVAERLAAVSHPPSVVLVSSREATAYGPRLEAAAASGFLPKGELTGAALRALIA